MLKRGLVAASAAPIGHGSIVSALMMRVGAPTVSMAGTQPDQLLAAARKLSPMTTILVPPGAEKPNAVQDAQWREAGEGAAFLCIGSTCSLPLRDADALRAHWRAMLNAS